MEDTRQNSELRMLRIANRKMNGRLTALQNNQRYEAAHTQRRFAQTEMYISNADRHFSNQIKSIKKDITYIGWAVFIAEISIAACWLVVAAHI